MGLNGYQQYKAQALSTMTQGELLMLLYDELIKRLTRAELALKKQDYETFEASASILPEFISGEFLFLLESASAAHTACSTLKLLYS